MPEITLHHGDCLEVMRTLADASVDAVVTDPPYELNFMGREWDRRGITYRVDLWAEVLRLLRPGGHLLAFGGTRTYHRLAVAIEDAGFAIEDSIHWIYGQGFPKHKSKLKPAHEPIVLATRPGGAKWLGVDACRVESASPVQATAEAIGGYGGSKTGHYVKGTGRQFQRNGRWPTNLVLTHHPDCVPCGTRRVKVAYSQPTVGLGRDTIYRNGDGVSNVSRVGRPVGFADADGMETVEAWQCVPGCPVAELDAQSGESISSDRIRHNGAYHSVAKGKERPRTSYGHADSGGASRFFPTFAWGDDDKDDLRAFFYCGKATRQDRGEGNGHPTVKPTGLCQWLTRLVTPPGGTILDPFLGSGSTLKAAKLEGFGGIGIDISSDYLAIADRRIAHAQPALAGLA
jgi:DNA modification methylase